MGQSGVFGGESGDSGWSQECTVGTEGSQMKSPSQRGQVCIGNPPGSEGGKPSTAMSSIQSS